MNKTVRTGDLNTTLPRGRQEEPFLNRYASMSVEARSNIKALMGYKGPKNWEGLSAVPPNSILEGVLELFRSETDIPLELPLMTVLSFVSGFLNSVQAKYEVSGILMPARL